MFLRSKRRPDANKKTMPFVNKIGLSPNELKKNNPGSIITCNIFVAYASGYG
jgi:hypothetical protein